jgi:hypothetical protein
LHIIFDWALAIGWCQEHKYHLKGPILYGGHLEFLKISSTKCSQCNFKILAKRIFGINQYLYFLEFLKVQTHLEKSWKILASIWSGLNLIFQSNFMIFWWIRIYFMTGLNWFHTFYDFMTFYDRLLCFWHFMIFMTGGRPDFRCTMGYILKSGKIIIYPTK